MPRRSLFVIALVTLATAACAGIDHAIVQGDARAVIAGPASVPAEATSVPGEATSTTDASAGASTTSSQPALPPAAGVAVVPAGGAPLSAAPGETPFMRIHEGINLGFLSRSGTWLEVVTTCNDTAWVEEGDVIVAPRRTDRQEPGPGFDLARAVLVVDPGHGDRDWGGVGPSETTSEKSVNLDISERIKALMSTSHDVDWETGAITAGSTFPAFGAVWLTRSRTGPNDGDYELGLGFRAELANAAGADAFVSIHNNTVPKVDTEIPGTEVYYSIGTEDSDRLASLIYEELLRGFASFEADWRGGPILGARARVDPDTGIDYYGVLRRTEMPGVIVEGVYISEPEEEALLKTEAFRQAYAEGVYRGVVRFLTTRDRSDDVINSPEPFPDDAGTVNTSKCVVPAQP